MINVVKRVYGRNKNVSNDQVKFASKILYKQNVLLVNFRLRVLLHLAWYCMVANDP